MVLDRFGVTRVGRWGAFLWAVASTITAIASGFGGILAARVLLGVAEAPAFPASQKATGYWFPTHERSRSTAIFDSAAKFSNVIGVPLVAFAIVNLGWRWGFGITAILSLAYFVAYWAIYRDPSEDKRLSKAEHDYILAGGATREGAAESGQSTMLGYLLRNRKVWGLTIGFSAYGYSFYLFLTWLPGYLVQTLHMSILKSAGYATIPWIFASLSDLLIGGFLVDHLIARGYDDTKVRKTVLVAGMLLGLAVFGAVTTTEPRLGHHLDHHRAHRSRGRRTGGFLDRIADRAPGRHRHHRRHRQFHQQSDGRRGPGDHRLHCRADPLLRGRVPRGRGACCWSASSPMS